MNKLLFFLILNFLSPLSLAQTSVSISAVNDYLFNGISQTGEDPALQLGLEFEHDSGWYVGAWGSNVDFGDGTDVELDVYAAYVLDISEQQSLQLGLAQYLYYGDGHSSSGNYAEAFAIWSIANTELSTWYANDYFGSGAGHVIVKAQQSIELWQEIFLVLVADHSRSLDDDLFEWDENKDSYSHWQIGLTKTLYSIDCELSFHQTDLDSYGDDALLLSVSRAFSF